MNKPAAVVKCGSVQIRIMRLSNGRFRFKYKQGNEWCEKTSGSLEDLKKRAFEAAKLIAANQVELTNLSADQAAACAWVVKRNLTVEMLELLASDRKDDAIGIETIGSAIREFLTIKKATAGRSNRNIIELTNNLGRFETRMGVKAIGSIKARDIELWLAESKTGWRRFNNLRASVVTLFRWARARGYLPDKTTEAERVAKAQKIKSTVTTITRRDLDKLINAVDPRYKPWLLVAAWAGIRTQEMFPHAGSEKSPLDWSDIHFDRKIIIVRPETAKTGDRRIVPICEALEKHLKPLALKSGRLGPQTAPSSRETQKLGKILGGTWQKNVLRHSFGTYRAAVTKNIGQVSLEMGNSQAMCLAHYHEAVEEKMGLEWFGVGGF